MPCTTILVGKKASYDGSTIIARNDDSGSGHYTSKKLAVIKPEEQPKIYKSVISHVEIELPENPMRYTAMPKTEKKKFLEESGKRILYTLYFHTYTVQGKVSNVLAAC